MLSPFDRQTSPENKRGLARYSESNARCCACTCPTEAGYPTSTNIQSQARQCFEAQDTGVAVKLLHEAVEEANEHKRNRGGTRSDAWR